MENVVAGELLRRGGRRHLLPADDADVVGVGQLLGGGVGVVGVHVVDGAAGHDDVVEGLLEGADRQVGGADSEQGQGVDANHDGNEDDVKDHLEKKSLKRSCRTWYL